MRERWGLPLERHVSMEKGIFGLEYGKDGEISRVVPRIGDTYLSLYTERRLLLRRDQSDKQPGNRQDPQNRQGIRRLRRIRKIKSGGRGGYMEGRCALGWLDNRPRGRYLPSRRRSINQRKGATQSRNPLISSVAGAGWEPFTFGGEGYGINHLISWRARNFSIMAPVFSIFSSPTASSKSISSSS